MPGAATFQWTVLAIGALVGRADKVAGAAVPPDRLTGGGVGGGSSIRLLCIEGPTNDRQEHQARAAFCTPP